MNSALSMAGMALRAGRLEVGEDPAGDACRERRCRLLLTAPLPEPDGKGVVAGLVSAPVLAVPTSVGYGASLGGVAALLAMLNSCSSGISVVNIDNGFGAAFQASLINHL